MKNLSPYILLIFLLFCNTAKVYAEKIEITASVDKTSLELGDFIRYTISIHGKLNTDQPQLPPLEDFSLLFGPSISTQTNIVNNTVSVFRGFTYGLTPQRKGKITIGPAVLKY